MIAYSPISLARKPAINSNFTMLLIKQFHSAFVRNNIAYANIRLFGCSNWRASIEQMLDKNVIPKESSSSCIYKVPSLMREVEIKAYEPNIVSIGPYHHKAKHLQAMEKLKQQVFHRLFNSNRAKLHCVMDSMENLEEKARNCYADDINLGQEEFLKMMILDGCFIVEMLKEYHFKNQNFERGLGSVKRWMLSSLRRDFIMLENQLPLFVLLKLFHLTQNISTKLPTPSFQELALSFFNPLMEGLPMDLPQTRLAKTLRWLNKTMKGGPKSPIVVTLQELSKAKHLLHLFRISIIPTRGISTNHDEDPRGNQPHVIRSVLELKAAGIKIMAAEDINSRPLEINFEKEKMVLKRPIIKIPRLHIDDPKGTLFRNLVAFEKCHRECNPDVTTYLFFLDGLINSAEDVEILHYDDVLHHSLGSNEEVAQLVNSLCKEVRRDVEDSYLYEVVNYVNAYVRDPRAVIRATLVRHYFSSWVVGISTLGAIFALYLTLIQTGFGAVGNRDSFQNFTHFLVHLKDSLFLRFESNNHTRDTIIGDEE